MAAVLRGPSERKAGDIGMGSANSAVGSDRLEFTLAWDAMKFVGSMAAMFVASAFIDDIQQKKGFISFCASVALSLGILVILWASRAKPNNPN